MPYNPKNLAILFSNVAEKAKLTLEHADADLLAEEINNYDEKSPIRLSGKFLYETQRNVKNAVKNDLLTVNFNPNYINRIAQYLDFRDFSQFRDKVENPTRDNKKEEKEKNSQNQHTTIIGKNINKIEGDINDSIINNN